MLDHALAVAASDALATLNTFIETRFALADELEATEPEAAAEMRATWTDVWETLADAPTRAIHAELHEAPVHTPDLAHAAIALAV